MKHLAILFLAAFCFSHLAFGQRLVPTLDKATQKYGYKEEGKVEWSLPPVYDDANSFAGNLAIVREGEYTFAINFHGRKVSPNFKKISPSSNFIHVPFICQDMDGNYNLYDTQFQPLCKSSYPYMSYARGYNAVFFKSEGLKGLKDMEGNTLIPPIYQTLSLENYHAACGGKKCNKDGLDRQQFDEALFEAQNTEGKWGIVTFDNEVIVPLTYDNQYVVKTKGAKGAYKKKIKPYLLSDKKRELDQRIQEARRRSTDKNKELAAIYPTDLPIVEKTVVKKLSSKKNKKGYAFFKAGKQVGKTYQSIDQYDKCCVVKENGKYGVTDPLGAEFIDCKYDNICIWNAGMGDDILLAQAGGKYELISVEGTKLSAKDCDVIFLPLNNAGVAMKGGQYWLIDAKGNIVSQCGYENIDNYSADDRIYATRLGYKTELTADGKEVSPIIKQIFDKAYAMSSTDNAQGKYDTYMLCISQDPDNKVGYRAMALNNIGVLFEELGDVDTALEYYGQARDLGNERARKNIKQIKLNRTLQAIEQVGNALSEMGQTIEASKSNNTVQQGGGNYGTYGSYTTTQQGSGNVGGNYGVATEGNSNKRSYEFWQQQYDRWERNAKSCYDALTNSGYKTKKNGKDTGGSAAGSWGGASFTGMKSNLRTAQREMKNTRAKARQDGYNIPQSTYETINVSF